MAKPGKYSVECSVPPLPKMFAAFGWTGRTADLLDENRAALTSEVYVNDQPVGQEAFGGLDADVLVTGMPGQNCNEVLNLKARIWNVILENLTPGQFTMRIVWHASKEIFDGDVTWPAGDYDTSYKITVDPSLAVPEGAPAPVALVIEPVGVSTPSMLPRTPTISTRSLRSLPTTPSLGSRIRRSRTSLRAGTRFARGWRQTSRTTST